mmetsp:Transcript_60064/g.130272  ORF Transcript_60064/g.130272 Transcript_60064/m.130272 type:complete len:218 (+) Transcript_60064:208-861(+)
MWHLCRRGVEMRCQSAEGVRLADGDDLTPPLRRESLKAEEVLWTYMPVQKAGLANVMNFSQNLHEIIEAQTAPLLASVDELQKPLGEVLCAYVPVIDAVRVAGKLGLPGGNQSFPGVPNQCEAEVILHDLILPRRLVHDAEATMPSGAGDPVHSGPLPDLFELLLVDVLEQRSAAALRAGANNRFVLRHETHEDIVADHCKREESECIHHNHLPHCV